MEQFSFDSWLQFPFQSKFEPNHWYFFGTITLTFCVHSISWWQVALELTPYLPSEGEINRWCGEPVEMIIIPSTLFKSLNNNNQISLEQPYRDVCLQLLHSTQAHFAVRCTHEDPWMSSYAHCLRNTFYGSASSSKMNHEYVDFPLGWNFNAWIAL